MIKILAVVFLLDKFGLILKINLIKWIKVLQ
jgi:hypothetical protein